MEFVKEEEQEEQDVSPVRPRVDTTIDPIVECAVVRPVNLIIYANTKYRVVPAREYQTTAYALFRKMRSIHQLFTGLTGDSYTYAPTGDITVYFPEVIQELLVACDNSCNNSGDVGLLHPELLALANAYLESLPEGASHMMYKFQITEDMAFGTRDGLALFINESGRHIPIWNDDKLYSLRGYMTRMSEPL